MNASDRRRLVLLLKSKDVRASLKSFLAQPKRFKKPIQREREAKEKKERLGRKGATAAIRAECLKRANGFCESGVCFDLWTEMDHWLGGNGRRRQKQSVETCWMLCRRCHHDRTNAVPSAAFWNGNFALHCARYGYKFEPHIEHAKLSPDRRLSAVPLGPAVDPGVSSQTKEREC